MMKKTDWRKVGLSYVLATITGVIGFFYWFRYRQTVGIIMVNSDVSTWSWQFIELFTSIVYGIVWLLLLLLCQYLYAKELKKRWLSRAFIGMTIVQAIFFLASWLIISFYTS